jgi:threonine/homoserine/homoserine lactone efflux protein
MTLEDRYRRILRLYPKAWRAEHEDDIVAVLLDAAGSDRDTIAPADVFDLVRNAIVLRFRAARPGLVVSSAVLFSLAVISVLALGPGRSPRGVPVEFLVTSLIVVLIPGTGVVYTLSHGIGGGRRRGVFAAIGCTLGIVPHLAAAMVGLSGLMNAGATTFEVLRWTGVGYLGLVGISMIRGGGSLQPSRERGADDESMYRVVRRGILLNLLNPKLTVFFFAFLPQFLDSAPAGFEPRLMGLGGIFMMMTLVVFIGYAHAGSVVRDRVLAAPRVLTWLQRALGTLLLGFATRLAVADR